MNNGKRRMNEALKQQRDELLVALKDAARIMLRAGLAGAASKAQRVIDKAEGGK